VRDLIMAARSEWRNLKIGSFSIQVNANGERP
jgi:hypothetical protein